MTTKSPVSDGGAFACIQRSDLDFLGKSEACLSAMADPDELAELNQRIAALQEYLRDLVEQAAAHSGAADEARTADRIAVLEVRLAELLRQRDVLSRLERG